MPMTMSGYTKLFSSILGSTVWREPVETRIVWITLLALADKDGLAEASIPGLADFARVSVTATRDALRRLLAPDPDSRSQEHQGRRIEPTEGGWRLLNHAKYRAKMGADERREYNRLKQAQYRTRQHGVNTRQQTSMTVNESTQCVDNTEAEAEAEAGKIKIVSAAPSDGSTPTIVLTFPVVGTKGRIWHLTQGQIDAWAEAFPNLEVLAEARKAMAWITAETTRRKTAKGMPRFLVGWLNRAADSSRGVTRPVNQLHVASQQQRWIEECEAIHDGKCESSAAHWRKKNGL